MDLDPRMKERMALVDARLADRLGLKDVALGVCLVVLSGWSGGWLGLPVLEHPLARFAVCFTGMAMYWKAVDWYEDRYGEMPGVRPETLAEKLPFYVVGIMFLVSPLPSDSVAFDLFMVVVYSATLGLVCWMIASMLLRMVYIPHSIALMASCIGAGLVSSSMNGSLDARLASIELLVLGFSLTLFGIWNHRKLVGTFGPGPGAEDE